jgi:hypothetical protein
LLLLLLLLLLREALLVLRGCSFGGCNSSGSSAAGLL